MKNLKNNNKKLGILILAIPVGMFLLAFASVPLYDLFCKVTGYGGTIQETFTPSNIVIDKEIKVRFNADKEKNLGVYFQPIKRSIITKLGETNSIEYKITNNTNKAIEAIASYNVTPQKAGIYFNKLDCFCYEENTILPGETISLPVTFFISPNLYDDPNTNEIKSITLSYTFFNTNNINVRNFQ